MSSIDDKVIKLINLSKNNSNINEAAAAFAKAQKLITKYNLDKAKLLKSDGTISDSILKESLFSGRRKSKWKTNVALATAKANNCFVFSERDTQGNFSLIIAGTKEDLYSTRYMFDSIINQLDIITKHFMSLQNMGRAGAKRIANSFKLGATKVIYNKLVTAVEEVEEEYKGTQALTIVKNKLTQAEKWVKSSTDLVTVKQPQSTIDRKAFAQGEQAGQRIQINKAISK